jgi:ketosteroid isomerase-like protein
MAGHGDVDLTRLERMERRLPRLEDAEAIRNLKSRYAALCDDNYDADGIAALFTEDATWDSPGLGRFEGRNAVRGFFRGAAGIFSFAIHYSLNGQIYVDGDTARAQSSQVSMPRRNRKLADEYEATALALERAQSVRRRAYQMWEEQGRPHGLHADHWYVAERELAAGLRHSHSDHERPQSAARSYRNCRSRFSP